MLHLYYTFPVLVSMILHNENVEEPPYGGMTKFIRRMIDNVPLSGIPTCKIGKKILCVDILLVI